jgi:polyketide synthase PksN
MIDFIEYVVSELKSKRLSKENALDLINQFSHRSAANTRPVAIHPLVHTNTSDLSQQSFSTTFNGDELFLKDHKVKGQKVLPGVAYLEMARAAAGKAMPFQQGSVMELRNVIWAQPIVVDEVKTVTIALFAGENEIDEGQVYYEVYSTEMEEEAKETVHCQGQAVSITESVPVKLDIDKLKEQMQRGKLEADHIYTAYSRLGLDYGPSHRGIKTILRGDGQLLVQLNLPTVAGLGIGEYVLHPGLMDSALQSAIGLLGDLSEMPDRPSLPFALESLRVFSACSKEMFAWVRYAEGSRSNDKVTKLNIDLCDQEGVVAVQMRGFSSRSLYGDMAVAAKPRTGVGAILAAPVWQTVTETVAFNTNTPGYAQQYIVLCEMPDVKAKQLEALLGQSNIVQLYADQQKNIAERFNEYALACFELVRDILANKPQDKVLIQLVVPGGQEQMIFAGLSGLLRTATLENPRLIGQLIATHPQVMAAELAAQLRENQTRAQDVIVRYEAGTRQVLRWEEIPSKQYTSTLALKDNGVYLITAGLGGLGRLFAKEILRQTRNARIILTGRSEMTAEKQAVIDQMQDSEGQLVYRQLDVASLDKVREFMGAIIKEERGLNGIFHCAGMISDNFIIKKSSEEFAEVLTPKVTGTYNLDAASKDIDLDFLVLFSSISSITGNSGQADYATANGFMDQFAAYRNQLVEADQRQGKTIAVNWPLWQEGGMKVDSSNQEMIQRSTGMHPMRTDTGLHAFYNSLELPQSQVLVVEGDLQLLHQTVFFNKAMDVPSAEIAAREEKAPVVDMHAGSLEEKTQDYIKKQLSDLFKLPSRKIDPYAPLEKYGIDSILAMNLTNQLEKTFGSLPKTLFFEYQTIRELTDYFIRSHPATLASLFVAAQNGREKPAGTAMDAPAKAQPGQLQARAVKRRRPGGVSGEKKGKVDTGAIAIIGLSGRYPKAVNIEAYWNNLRDGKDCITEVPGDRWNWKEYYSEDRNKSGSHYSKWGGFIEGVDQFDPLFFNISPLEAQILDPQERLFLQHAWMAVEDAGYTRSGLQVPHDLGLPGQVGVYAGVMYSEYQLFGIEATRSGQRIGIPGSYASIANRVSYVLNLHGPSMTVDSMCSSSLTAIHLACQDLKQGRTSLGIAGGVNVSIHPNKYLVISAGQYISSDGHCQSFGEGGEGYIPGEGVGVVVLKRLSEAVRDGDHIYGIIKGSALNHGGRTNGYSVPNPQAQSNLISSVLAETNTDPRHISYIEAHGTGTKLGDPIEIAALTQAFQRSTADTGFCLIGSAKSNIGHCESAAGIAGLTKVLLQLKHRRIVPSLHSKSLNPNIDFQRTPFIVSQTLSTWEQPVINGLPQPRLAAVSSFGAGGSNAHIIVQEYVSPAAVSQPVMLADTDAKVIIPLSARTAGQLKQKALDLLGFLQQSKVKEEGELPEPVDLNAMAYTLQTGREGMDIRLGFMVSSVEELLEKLQAYINGEEYIEDAYWGQTDRDKETLSLFNADTEFEQTIDKWIAQGKLSKLLDLWTKGLNLDWNKFYGNCKPKRISLPTYPFARDRYWIDIKENGQGTAKGKTTSVLHPLLHSNTSDLNNQRYSAVFSGEEFFLQGHQVKMNEGLPARVLPAVAYLEMARIAVERSTPPGHGSGILELHNIAWAQPLVVEKDRQVDITLLVKENNHLNYEIYSKDNGQEITHCLGAASYVHGAAPQKLDLEQLRDRMSMGRIEAASLYPVFAAMGLVYGPAYQGIKEIYKGEKQVLAQLSLPAALAADQAGYGLHPSLMDSALQAAAGLMDDLTKPPLQPALPFALDTIRIISASTENMFAWVRYAEGSGPVDAITKLDLDLSDEEGNVCVQMRGLSLRQLVTEDIGTLLAYPVWEVYEIPKVSADWQAGFLQQHIILCELPQVEADRLKAFIQDSHCIQLSASQKTIAERYSEYALACFEQVREIINARPEGKVLIQVVVAGHAEQALFAGLSGLLKTAAQENPKISGQIILTTPGIHTEMLAEQLQRAQARPGESFIKYEEGTAYVLRWKDVPANREDLKTVFRDQGVYLVTGGLGALGILFTREILQQTQGARIILTGRTELTEEKQAILDKLPAGASQVMYQQLDLNDLDQVKTLVAAITKDHGRLNGIIHSAGMISDGLILKKTGAEFSSVLAPKVTGTYNLDQASKDLGLDFLVLFSSLSGAMGNVGQADYATANAFMDQFAMYRNQLVDQKARHGRTLSINWPLWKEGHLGIDREGIDLLRKAAGILPMQTSTGIRAFYNSMALRRGQVMVMEGDLKKMGHILLPAQISHAEPALASAASTTLVDKTINYLRKHLAEALKLPVQDLDPKAPLENYGIDSILAMRLTSMLEETFGSLSKTLFFEYQTIKSLAAFFANTYPHIIREKVGAGHTIPSAPALPQDATKKQPPVSSTRSGSRFFNNETNVQREVAIVGLSGKYPLAENMEEFWDNLKNGRDCITEIPGERWDTRRFFDPRRNQAGKSYSKWGGFIADVDKFDPLFFNISPKEAELIDPQERLFMEAAWQTFEDAGYSKEGISALGRVGVYVGVMYGQYQLYGAEAMLAGNTFVPGSSYASIANRVSYFFDLRGPSIALDTMCSSSLTAIYLACEEIRKGEIDAAIAGGVNVSIHPHKYLMLSQGNFASTDGRCRSFGDGGDGYVAGEGVGAILLKSLDRAIADGDHIYGVIRSGVINHGGKTNGYSVPNPNAQGDLILAALKKAKIDPSTLSYIETHGTGTALGDPIEITGLTQAFGTAALNKQFCPIGSVKSNIGHLESAAGIASVTKVLLQLRHKKLVPSLHAATLNANIDFKGSPFYVQRELTEWECPAGYPRRAGISSFGAGGANAHLIIEEYDNTIEEVNGSVGNIPHVFVLSSKTRDGLLKYAERMRRFLQNNREHSLTDMAYTLHIGRTPMNERLAVVAASLNELEEKLAQWLSKTGNNELEGIYHGNIKNAPANTETLLEGEEGRAYLRVIMETGNLDKLAKLWISGADIDWSLLYQDGRPKRISLPTYPFARERYWINMPAFTLSAEQPLIPKEERQQLYYYPKWAEHKLNTTEDRSPDNGSTLVLDTTDELFLAMKEQYAEEHSLILVKLANAYQEIAPAVFSIDPQQEEHFKKLVESLAKKGLLPQRIIHQGVATGDLYNQEDLGRQLSYGVYTLFSLCQALMKQKHQAPIQIVSIGAGNTGVTAPQHAAMGSFFNSLSLENPLYRGKVVEVQGGLRNQQVSAAEKALIVLNECRDDNWNKNEIRYKLQEGKQFPARYVRELAQFIPHVRNTDSLPVKQNGVYIVSGGLGGLGLLISEYLVKKYQCKLVLFGRSALQAAQEEKLDQLKASGTEIIYLQADAASLADMEMVVKTAKNRFKEINGVIHSAGINKDSFIIRKPREEMDKVLASKIYGTVNLDLATREEKLDLFILFSSICGVTGNIGQCDYAYANHFLDSFAENREALVKEQQRFGRTLSINWPYWEEGGMHISKEEIALMEEQTGLCPLPAKEGIRCLEALLLSDLHQCMPLYGFASRIRSYVEPGLTKAEKSKTDAAGTMGPDDLPEQTAAYLKALIGEEIKLDPERMDPQERFESFGIDSIIISRINVSLERDLGVLPKTLFYEYATIEELATFLARDKREALIRFLNVENPVAVPAIQDVKRPEAARPEAVPALVNYEEDEPIAIIGVHGTYPKSDDLNKYWENLKQGKDLTDLVPASRWDYGEFYHEDPEKAAEGKMYCKWGGFINDVDKFDPHFFNITPEEAKIMDPQERLFLQSVWAAIEDAGYTMDSLKKRYPKAKSANVGVFVGVTTNTYNLLASEEWSKGNSVPSAHPWSIANRVSYLFDFNGPSMPVDTACSSSSVAIHLACESLKKKECQVAVAGGVNLYLHPSKYHSLCKSRMVSRDGKCHSYGAGDDGFVPGEGVGSVLLKPLSKAIEDRDHIYAVLKGSAFDHSGRSNGYSAPNPNAQAGLIEFTLRKAQVHPETISYVEGHGTGTRLGDNLEIVALTNAFQKQTGKKQFSPLGSVKANIGHPESAAGIAGVTKVLLQMKHQQLAPTIHSDKVNPDIAFNESPFYLQHQLSPWQPSSGYPRRALINSFGAGGVNACLVLEEYKREKVTKEDQGPHLVVLSAKNKERLLEYVNRLLTFLGKEKHVNLSDLSFTLQTGREAMAERLAIVIPDRAALIERLKDWKQQKPSDNIYEGKFDPRQGRKKSPDREEELRTLLASGNLDKLAQLWVAGVEVDWHGLYPQDIPNRVPLPTYPFAKDRYWVLDQVVEEKKAQHEPQSTQLHPLVSYNSSTLREVSFTSLLSDSEFYASDHQVNGEKLFPGAGFIEIAGISGNLAGEQKVCRLKDLVWAYPLSFKNGPQFIQTLLKPGGRGVEFSIASFDDENERIIHSEGKLYFQNGNGHPAGMENIPVQQLKKQCGEPQSGAYYYNIFRQVGFNYGAAFKTIQEFYVSDAFALSKLKLADHLKSDSDRFILHPCIVDGALQTVAGLVGQMESAVPYVPFAIDEIEIFRSLPHTCYAYVEHGELEGRSRSDVKKFNIKIINEGGDVLVSIKNFYVRAFVKLDIEQDDLLADPYLIK